MEIPSDNFEKNENESSLSLFIKYQCKITTFEEDVIEVEEFKNKYREFCVEKRLPSSIVSRNIMKDMFQIETAPVATTYLERIPTTYMEKLDNDANKEAANLNSSITYYKIDKELIETRIKQSFALHSTDQEFYKKNRGDPFVYVWYLIDMLAVLLHFVFVIIITLIFAGIPYFYELMLGKYSLSEYHDTIKLEDWSHAPWNILYKLRFLNVWSIVFFI